MSLNKWLPLLIIAPVTILIDQLSKLWIINNVFIGETVPIIEGIQPYLQITRTTNTGFAFGLATGGNLIILVLSALITTGLFWMYASSRPVEGIQRIGFALVIGGAIGNIIDRIRLGHVVDFVHLTIPNLISNVSNFADHFVVIGVIVLLADSFFNPVHNGKPNPEIVQAVGSESD